MRKLVKTLCQGPMAWVSNAYDENWSSHPANAAWVCRSLPTDCPESSPASGTAHADQWALTGVALAGAS
jgi:hypothetical protein